MDSHVTHIQGFVDDRIKKLKMLEDLERRLKDGSPASSGALDELLRSQTDLIGEEKTIVEQSASIRHLLLPDTKDAPSPRLSAGAVDGYTPPVGWDQGWVLTTLALSDKQTLNLVDLLKVGAGVEALTAALLTAGGLVPVAVCAGIASALFVIGSSALAIRNRNGGHHGIYWKFTYLELVGGAPVIAIHSQVYFARHK